VTPISPRARSSSSSATSTESVDAGLESGNVTLAAAVAVAVGAAADTDGVESPPPPHPAISVATVAIAATAAEPNPHISSWSHTSASERLEGSLTAVEPTYFATPQELRTWFDRHHTQQSELLVGFYKKGSGVPSITWPEAVDEALCAGWIDGVRRRVDDQRYSIRFSPRTTRSTWSAVNIKRAKELIELGRMRPAGLEAFERRTDDRSAIYSYEQRRDAALDPAHERRFRRNRAAWRFFEAQPAGYRRTAIHWVVSAKKDETRERRLATLIDDSEHQRTIAPLRRRPTR
jgi:uncharacterized protein YdeI (YjbR/CyaY-like superfamily)